MAFRQFSSELLKDLWDDVTFNHPTIMAGMVFRPAIFNITGIIPRTPLGAFHLIDGPIKYNTYANDNLIFLIKFEGGHYVEMTYSQEYSWKVRLAQRLHYDDFEKLWGNQ